MVLSSMDIIIILPIVDEVKKKHQAWDNSPKKNNQCFHITRQSRSCAWQAEGSLGVWVMGAEWQGMLWLNPILGCCSEFVLGKSMEELYTVHELDELVTLDELDELLGKRSEKS